MLIIDFGINIMVFFNLKVPQSLNYSLCQFSTAADAKSISLIKGFLFAFRPFDDRRILTFRPAYRV